jgi:hypothetical protein
MKGNLERRLIMKTNTSRNLLLSASLVAGLASGMEVQAFAGGLGAGATATDVYRLE